MRSVFFDPGQMTARLDLERPVETPDGQGGSVRSLTGRCRSSGRGSSLSAKCARSGRTRMCSR